MATDYWAVLEEGNFYHIYNRSVVDGKLIFRSPENYRFFLGKFNEYITPFLDIWGYCLLPDHFHFLVHVPEEPVKSKELIRKASTKKAKALLEGHATYSSFLEDQFKRLFASYAHSFNRYHNQRGSVFQKRFKRVLLRTDLRLLYTICYIHHNPIHHRLAQTYDSWAFSSYKLLLGDDHEWLSYESVQLFFHRMGLTEDWRFNFLELHRQFQIDFR
ncbi:MAG: hypothetical protein H6573_20080 [Lewinellaceae bacterium]|nr:hypothetical protein [Lewinellaceae bacterium]